MTRRQIIIAMFAFIIGLVAINAVRHTPWRQIGRGDTGHEPTAQAARCISNPNPVFTHDITDLKRIRSIIPPGTTSGGHYKSHSFIGTTGRVSVYAPTDSTLESGAYYSEGGIPQYNLWFRVSCEVTYKLDHILEPTASIRAAFPSTPASTTRGQRLRASVSLKAGELIGYTTGTPQAHNWDFGVYNTARPNTVVLPTEAARRETNNRIAQCPYDYYTEPQRTAYQKLYADFSGGSNYPRTFCRR